MVYAPVRDFDEQGKRVYSKMHTAEWWWEMQVAYFFHSQSGSAALGRADHVLGIQDKLPHSAMIIPIILRLDITYLTNYSSDKKIWPVYMTIGNIKSEVRNRPSAYAWIPIALLPVSPKKVQLGAAAE